MTSRVAARTSGGRGARPGDCGARAGDPGAYNGDRGTRPGERGGRPGAHNSDRSARHGERGAGTVLVLGVVAVALLLGLGLAALGAAQAARGAAQAAADLGALAGATALRDGFDACATAHEAVQRNGSRLVLCEPGGGATVRVVAARAADGPTPGPWAGLLGEARAAARAGPRQPP